MKGTTKNKVKYWAHALAMDSEALHYTLGIKSRNWEKHVRYYLPIFKDTIRCLEGVLEE